MLLVLRVYRAIGMGPVRVDLQRAVNPVVEDPGQALPIPFLIEWDFPQQKARTGWNRLPELHERRGPLL
jgi:hypothetical protein